MKYIALPLSFLLMLTAAHITAYGHENHFRNGFFIGTKGGYIASKITLRDEELRYTFNNKDGVVGLYGGYGFRFNNFYLIPEITLHHSLASSSSPIWIIEDSIPGVSLNLQGKFSQKWIIEPRIRIGYVIRNTMAYLHAGMSMANERFTAAMIVRDNNRSIENNYANKRNFWRTGFVYGGDIEIPITNTFSIYFEGAHTVYNHKNITARNEYPTYDGRQLKLQTKIKDYVKFTSGIIYRF